MMWNILVHLLMLKSRFSIVWQSCGLQQDLLCSNQTKPVERSEKIIPPPGSLCAQRSWPWSCLHRNISCWFWADSTPVDCTDDLLRATKSGAVPLLLIPILELSHPLHPSPLFPLPTPCTEPWQPHSAPCVLPEPLAGLWHGVWTWLLTLRAEYCRVWVIGIAHGSCSLQKNMFKQGKILSLAISCRENCLGSWVIEI